MPPYEVTGMVVTRKGFLQFVVSSVGLSALGLAACGDDDGSTGAGGAGTTGPGTTGPTSSTTGTKSSSSATGTSQASTSGNTTVATTTGGMLTCNSDIANNHPQAHTIEVTPADVEAGVEKLYDIMGASMHTHSVTVTAADFTTLAGGGSVMITSTMGGQHTHVVTVTCMA